MQERSHAQKKAAQLRLGGPLPLSSGRYCERVAATNPVHRSHAPVAGNTSTVTADFSSCGGEIVQLSPGESLEFGRNVGRGQIQHGIDRSVSSIHGVITAGDGTWSVRSTGRLYCFTVYDNQSPSKLSMPMHTGPVFVPFSRATVAIEIAERRHVFGVACAGAPGWADGWTPLVKQIAEDAGTGGTDVAARHRDMKHATKGGRELRWFHVLVALCESRLRSPYDAVCPSRAEVAKRLGVSSQHIDETYMPRITKELGLSLYRPSNYLQFVEAVVTVAIGQRVVVPGDLALLDAR